MKDNLNLILSDNLIKIAIFSSGFLILFQALLILLFFPKLPPLIPFLNSQPWGEERLYPANIVFLIPVLLIIIFVINNFLSAAFYKRNTLMARILSFNSLLFIFLCLLAFAQIILLVF